MRDDASAGDDTKHGPAGESGPTANDAYVPPRLTKVGNVRELLAGEGGTIPETDPSAFDPQKSSPQGP